MNMTNLVQQLNEISSAVMYATEGLDLEEVLQRIAQVSRNLAQCRYAALGIPNNVGGLRYFITTGMTEEEIALMDHLPLGHGLIRAPMRERHPIRLARMQDDERSVGFPKNHPEMTSLLGIPIQIGQQLFGVLYLCDRNDGLPFDENDQQIIETLAGYAALAISSATANDQQSRLRVLEERERIGMVLHDGVIQSLYALGMQLDLLRMNEQVEGGQLKPVIQGLDMVISDIRRYILQLRAVGEQNKSIYECLNDMVAKLMTSQEVEIHLSASHDYPPFPPASFEGICLIINEALSNAIRHAHASLIEIDAKIENNKFLIEIRDNGFGFDTSHALTSGLGLGNMHKRARIYGGQVEVDSKLGKGTRLTITIPVKMF